MPVPTQGYLQRSMFVLLCLGFSSGLPLALTGGTLQAWMTTEGIDLKAIAAFSLIGLPYTLKFVWSPLMDRFVPPFLGRRRGWIIICQVALALLLVWLGFSRPGESIEQVALIAILVSFFSASQDIVIDAYRTDSLAQEELGRGAAVTILGYRIAMLVSGGLALIIAADLGFRTVYLIMAALVGVGALGALCGQEPKLVHSPGNLRQAVIDPFLDFLRRKGALEVLLFIVIYKLGDAMALSITTPFLIKLGFQLKEIGWVFKVLGLAATIFGSLYGGALLAKLGMKRALEVFGLAQALAILSFSVLAVLGPKLWMLMIAVGLENITSGMGTAAFLAFIMSMCNKSFSATQFALLSALSAVPRVIISSTTGILVELSNWPLFFGSCALIAIPGVVLVQRRFERWQIGGN